MLCCMELLESIKKTVLVQCTQQRESTLYMFASTYVHVYALVHIRHKASTTFTHLDTAQGHAVQVIRYILK